jgi:hypothetical protein
LSREKRKNTIKLWEIGKSTIKHCTLIKNYNKFKQFHIAKLLTMCYAEKQRAPPGKRRKRDLEEK